MQILIEMAAFCPVQITYYVSAPQQKAAWFNSDVWTVFDIDYRPIYAHEIVPKLR